MRRSLFLAAMCAAGLAAALAHADDHPIYYYAGASAGSVTAANAWSSKNNTTDIVPATTTYLDPAAATAISSRSYSFSDGTSAGLTTPSDPLPPDEME